MPRRSDVRRRECGRCANSTRSPHRANCGGHARPLTGVKGGTGDPFWKENTHTLPSLLFSCGSKSHSDLSVCLLARCGAPGSRDAANADAVRTSHARHIALTAAAAHARLQEEREEREILFGKKTTDDLPFLLVSCFSVCRSDLSVCLLARYCAPGRHGARYSGSRRFSAAAKAARRRRERGTRAPLPRTTKSSPSDF